jgi:hypothetical protein
VPCLRSSRRLAVRAFSRLVAPAAFAALAATGVATACTGLGITQAVAPLAGMPTLWITTILLSH